MTSNTTISSRDAIDCCSRAVYAPFALRAALQLDLFSKLIDRAMTASDLAQVLGVGHRRLEMLLYQLVLSEFLNLDNGRFSNSEVSDHYLVKERAAYIGGIHELWTEQWNNMLKIAEGIRTDQPQAKINFDGMTTEQLRGFLRGLHGTTIGSGRALATKFDFSRSQRIADVGGGSGGLSIALCRDYPDLTATIVELPSVAAIAAEFVAEAKLRDRIKVDTTDILAGPLERNFDVAVVKAVFQVMSEDNARKAMKNIAASLTDGGYLHVIGFVADNSRLSPEMCVGMNLIFINMFDDGQVYTEEQYREWLADAGLGNITRQPFIVGNSLITAQKT